MNAFGWGFLAWSLAEYLVHRFVLHRPGSRFWPAHVLHHREPQAEVGVSFETVFVLAFVSFVVACLISLACAYFVGGVVAGYVVYVTIHEALHRRKYTRGPLRWLQALHDQHHEGWNANYGVTSPFWDLLFDTYRGA